MVWWKKAKLDIGKSGFKFQHRPGVTLGTLTSALQTSDSFSSVQMGIMTPVCNVIVRSK